MKRSPQPYYKLNGYGSNFQWSPHQCFVDVIEMIFVRPAPVVIPDSLPRNPVEVEAGILEARYAVTILSPTAAGTAVWNLQKSKK